jgi:hypothetical protein
MEPSKAVAARLNRAGWQRQIAKQGGARAEKKKVPEIERHRRRRSDQRLKQKVVLWHAVS